MTSLLYKKSCEDFISTAFKIKKPRRVAPRGLNCKLINSPQAA